jgi:hypothetical protein
METKQAENGTAGFGSGKELPDASDAPELKRPRPNANTVGQLDVGPRREAGQIEAELRQALRPQVIEQVAVEKLKPRGSPKPGWCHSRVT